MRGRPQPRRARRPAFWPGLLLCVFAAGGAFPQDRSLETAVKATYLYKLAPFVTWPAQAYPNSASPLVICVQGADPFGPMLDRAVAGQSVDGRPVAVRRLARIEVGSGCQIAYVGGSGEQPAAQALTAVAGAPVLTVTDDARGAGARGIVHFVLSGGAVRFAIDPSQAAANHIGLSSKLLTLSIARR